LQVESELTELPFEERSEFLNSLGVSESCLGNLIRATYSLLGLRTYFTSGEKVNYLKKKFSEYTLRIHYLKEYFHILCRKQKLGPYFQVSLLSAELSYLKLKQ
jgi:hypothetical protein